MRDGTSDKPKPITPLGPRPLIWQVMRYYAHFGHMDFVLMRMLENGGYLVLRPEIFDYLPKNGDLVGVSGPIDECRHLRRVALA